MLRCQNIARADVDIHKIQFYNTARIQLSRVLSKEEIKTTSGEVKFENGKYYEVLIIGKYTSCIIDSTDDTRDIITVGFENGDNNVLPFKLENTRYKLNFEQHLFNGYFGMINCNGKEYKVEKGQGVYLAIKGSSRLIERTKYKFIRGIKIK